MFHLHLIPPLPYDIPDDWIDDEALRFYGMMVMYDREYMRTFNSICEQNGKRADRRADELRLLPPILSNG
ncbi:MAG: hypothetical protein LBU27_08095 [Candidatus Peribacteria bacterium]|jgi:hypothetical protein|nr:hypothetical protein [Candidatus Peribacteria bacterium]